LGKVLSEKIGNLHIEMGVVKVDDLYHSLSQLPEDGDFRAGARY
jgi:hypothetical protein